MDVLIYNELDTQNINGLDKLIAEYKFEGYVGPLKELLMGFADKLLKLAAENALLDKYLKGNFQDNSYKYLNNQGYSININKQSITDTIKQVE